MNWSLLLVHHLQQQILPFFYVILSRTCRGQNLGAVLGCSNSTPALLEACLQKADVTAVALQQYNVFTSSELLGIPFVPVVDGVFLPSDLNVKFLVHLMRCFTLPILLKSFGMSWYSFYYKTISHLM